MINKEVLSHIRIRNLALAGSLLAGGIALDACSSGQTSAPTVKDIQHNSRYFEVERPDGSKMECLEYGAAGYGINYGSASWFGLTCDWSGQYPTGPTNNENSATIGTTITTVG